jgi:hypothetical protein
MAGKRLQAARPSTARRAMDEEKLSAVRMFA